MLRILLLASACLVILAKSSAHADDPPAAKEEINAEVRGVLHFESGRGYFISIKPAAKTEREMRVSLQVAEDRELVRRLEGLDGKHVVARGKLAQMPEDGGGSLPPGLYLRHRFTIQGAD